MAIQKKHGKGRLDKWYHLAKEKGYRARAAFKLVQLNKKYGFLEKSKVLIDLCAAPGSWCQVAAETMPAGSLIIGVDLSPIKSIPRTITFQSDITTEKCRATLRSHIKHLKCDTVLHDGAPNVGIAWAQDAYSQAELVLQSMKLATEFLKEGGTFVTKVFRSKDYNALLWVFKQLFTSVEATKPPSSRNVSAEIFVVCRGYKAPKKLDPKFLDAKHVFAEVQEATPNNEAKVFNPEKKKRKREGYEEGDYTQHKEVPVSDFIHTTDPIAILGTVNTLSFAQPPNGDLALATIDRLPDTTPEIRQCCTDLKVLGKKEFRTLLRWRLKVRDIFGMSVRAKKAQAEKEAEETEEVAEVEEMDDELKMQGELQRLRDQNDRVKRKERRRENEKKQREIVRMQMHMTAPFDIGLEQNGPAGEGSMFKLGTHEQANPLLRQIKSRIDELSDESDSDTEDGEDDDGDNESDGDTADALDRQLDSLYESFQQRREEADAKQKAKRARRDRENDDWHGIDDAEKGSDDESEAENLPLRRLPQKNGLSSKAAMFFDQDIFQDLELGEDDPDRDSGIEIQDSSDDKTAKESDPVSIDRKETRVAAAEDSSSDDEEAVPAAAAAAQTAQPRPEDPLNAKGQFDIDLITAEAMTLAQSLASGQVKSSDLVDDSFNKHAFLGDPANSYGLPEWFLDDEQSHSKRHMPTTKAAAQAIREKLRALNARPIKKVREAKGRKKMRAAARLEKLKKKSALLVEDEGISEKDKATSLARMMARAAKKSKPKNHPVKLVVARGGNRGISGRPRGVKGRYKIVDPRLKKDVRAEKRLKKKIAGKK